MEGRKTLVNIGWLILSAGGNKLIQIISAIILSNLLNPEIFGLVTISLSIFYITQGVLNLGFESALIQDNLDKDNSRISSAWTLEIIKGFVLFSILYLLSPIISNYLNNDKLELLLKLTSFIFIIDSFKNINVIFLKKNMNFKKIFYLEFFPFLISNITTIIIAISIKKAWIIVFGLLINRLLYTSLSYVITDYRIKIEINIIKIKKLFNYGKWIFASSFFSILRSQGINVFISKFIGFHTLGIYNRSVTFSEEIFNQVSNLYWKFGFPYLSKHNLNSKKLNVVFNETFKYMFYVNLIMFLTVIIAANSFVNLFFDYSIWGEIVNLMQIISFYSFLILIQAPFGILYQAVGKPKYGTRINILFFILLLTLTYPLFNLYEINGVLISLTISSFISFIYNNYITHKHLNINLKLLYSSIINKTIITFLIFTAFIILRSNVDNFYINLLFPIMTIYFVFRKDIKYLLLKK